MRAIARTLSPPETVDVLGHETGASESWTAAMNLLGLRLLSAYELRTGSCPDQLKESSC